MTREQMNVAIVAILEMLEEVRDPAPEGIVALGIERGLGVMIEDAVSVFELGALARLWSREHHALRLAPKGVEMLCESRAFASLRTARKVVS